MCFETRRVRTRDFTVYVLCTYFYHYIWLSLHAYDKANKQIFALINFLHNVYKTLLLLVKHLTLFCRHKPKITPKYGFVQSKIKVYLDTLRFTTQTQSTVLPIRYSCNKITTTLNSNLPAKLKWLFLKCQPSDHDLTNLNCFQIKN